MWIVSLMMANFFKILPQVTRIERILLVEVGGEVEECLFSDRWHTSEDIDAEGAVDWNFLLKVHNVGVDRTCNVGVNEDAAGA